MMGRHRVAFLSPLPSPPLVVAAMGALAWFRISIDTAEGQVGFGEPDAPCRRETPEE